MWLRGWIAQLIKLLSLYTWLSFSLHRPIVIQALATEIITVNPPDDWWKRCWKTHGLPHRMRVFRRRWPHRRRRGRGERRERGQPLLRFELWESCFSWPRSSFYSATLSAVAIPSRTLFPIFCDAQEGQFFETAKGNSARRLSEILETFLHVQTIGRSHSLICEMEWWITLHYLHLLFTF